MTAMIACPSCGHQNLPNYPACSNCRMPLGGGGAEDEYQRLLRQREITRQRNRKITFAVLAVGVVGLGAVIWRDRAHRAEVQGKLDFVEAWVALDKKEAGGFWNCITQSQTPVDQFSSGEQVQAKIEMAFAMQPKTFPEFLRSDCVPKAEQAQSAARSMIDVPAEFEAPLKKYHESLGKLRNGIDEYAERLGKRGGSKSIDQLIQEMGDAWHSNFEPTPEGVAFESFLNCAIPGLQKLKDVQALLEFLADECYKRDPVAFMNRVRTSCGEILGNLDTLAKPSKTYKATMKKFFEDERRMMSAWEDCSRKSNKGSKSDDLAQFLHAVGAYMQARADIAKTGKEIQESI